MDDAPTTCPELPPLPAIAARASQVVHVVVEAIYEDGVIKPLVPLDLPAGTPISLQIATRMTATVVPGVDSSATRSSRQPWPPTSSRTAFAIT